MSFGVRGLFEQAEALLDRQRFVPAIETLEEAKRLTEIPHRNACAEFMLGGIYWTRLGDGVQARRHFLSCISVFDSDPQLLETPFKTMYANALENAMLCALSHAEFDDLARRLLLVVPDEPILSGLVPNVRDWVRQGSSWSQVLASIAAPYYDRNNPQQDSGRYGEAKSTYHLLLAHRKQLRMSNEEWGYATFELCALAMRMTADCAARRGEPDPYPDDEYLPMLTGQLSLVDEYLSSNPGDQTVVDARRNIEKIIEIHSRAVATPLGGIGPTAEIAFRCAQCHKAVVDPMRACPECGAPSSIVALVSSASIIGCVLGGGLAFLLLSQYSAWIVVLGVSLAGIIGMVAVGRLGFAFAVIRISSKIHNKESDSMR